MIAACCRLISGIMLSILLAFPCASAENQASGLAGHYYLSGVREVGSELILHTSGRYEWMLLYGAMDHASRGSWSLKNDRVVLQADIALQTGPVFSLAKRGISEWNADLEQLLREELFRQGRARVLESCPFLGIADYASSAHYTEEKPAPAELENRAQAALDELKKAVSGLEQAARDAMAARRVKAGADPDAAMQRATAAMERYQSAWAAVKDTHWAAGRVIPPRPVAEMPDECIIAPLPLFDPDQPVSWQRGIAVLVGDEQSGLRFSSIKVRLIYADGHAEERVTGRSGTVAVPSRAARLQRIELAVKDGPTETLSVPRQNDNGTLYHIQVDARILEKPFFTTFELHVQDGRLFSDLLGGSYAKH